VLDQAEAVRLLPPAGVTGLSGPTADRAGSIPAYAEPQAAAQALARAATYGAWRTRPSGHLQEFSEVKADDAREVVRAFLARKPRGGWLPPEEVAGLLACYGIPLADLTAAASDDDARAADRPADTEVVIGVAQGPVLGPLVTFRLGGGATDVRADPATRLAPLTDTDADELIGSVRSAPPLPGHGGAPPHADLTALRDTVVRVSLLADDLPELAELELNLVIARPDEVPATGARIRLAHAQPYDPFLRKLP
jgi:hypothetical protein